MITLLEERMHALDAEVRIFLISWITVLQSVPELNLDQRPVFPGLCGYRYLVRV